MSETVSADAAPERARPSLDELKRRELRLIRKAIYRLQTATERVETALGELAEAKQMLQKALSNNE